MWQLRRGVPLALVGVSLFLSGCQEEAAPEVQEGDGAISSCLCVFDIDRTLTGRQGDLSMCPRNKEMHGVHDNGYGSGNLTLSALAAIGINTTFCGKCHLGICSAGDADGDDSEERRVLLDHVLRTAPFDEFRHRVANATKWSWRDNVISPLVLGQPNKMKQEAVEEIRLWYSRHGVKVEPQDVYFFGDRVENIPPFEKRGFNAREISCGSRDQTLYSGSGMVGYCGARPEEIVEVKGIKNCAKQACGDEENVTSSCLCVFDIDRTLTGRQGDVSTCPRNEVIDGVHDNGYGSGNLTLSALAALGINTTFCGKCYLGICSAGDADGEGSAERAVLLDRVLRTSPFDELRKRVPNASTWSWRGQVYSPLVLGQPNRLKQHAVEDIRKWYSEQGICISSERVHFFGDRRENMDPFKQMKFNAREISCGSRDQALYSGSGMVGYCGARPEEIVEDKGTSNCAPQKCSKEKFFAKPSCLCVFDIDRTLTGRQGDLSTCPKNKIMPGVHDNGYGSGNLTLSALAAVGINTTFCGQCYLGICSAGDADGENSEERKVLLNQVLLTAPFNELRLRLPSASSWSWRDNVTSPLVLGQPNKLKQHAVEDIRKWYWDQGICISSDHVHFFGDRKENMDPFKEMRFNAREISCGSRDPNLYSGSGMVGYCGAGPDEIVEDAGVFNCA